MGKDEQMLLYLHRGKLNTEIVAPFTAGTRACVLQMCCATQIYRLLPNTGDLHEWVNSRYWTHNYSRPVPAEILIAAMIVN